MRHAGDERSGAGLPPAPAHGLPHGAAPAHAGVLAQGEEPEAQVCPDRQHPGQAAPQRRQPQSGHQLALRVSKETRGTPAVSSQANGLQAVRQRDSTESCGGRNRQCEVTDTCIACRLKGELADKLYGQIA